MQAVNRRDDRQELLNGLVRDVYAISVSLSTLSTLLASKADTTVNNPLTDTLYGTATLLKLCDESLDDVTSALRSLANQEGGMQ